MNKSDFHLCGTCGTYLFLTGKFRYRRFFFLLLPAILAVLLFTLVASDWLGWIQTEGPTKGSPSFSGWLLTMGMTFSVLSAINGRREEVESVKLEGGPTQ